MIHALIAGVLLLAAGMPGWTASAAQFRPIGITFFGGSPPRGGEPMQGQPAMFGLKDARQQHIFQDFENRNTVLQSMNVSVTGQDWSFSNVRIVSVNPPAGHYSAYVVFSFTDFRERNVPLPTPDPNATPEPPRHGEPAFFESSMTGKIPLVSLGGDKMRTRDATRLFLGVSDTAGAHRLRNLIVRRSHLGEAYVEDAYGARLMILHDALVTGCQAHLYSFPLITVLAASITPTAMWEKTHL